MSGVLGGVAGVSGCIWVAQTEHFIEHIGIFASASGVNPRGARWRYGYVCVRVCVREKESINACHTTGARSGMWLGGLLPS